MPEELDPRTPCRACGQEEAAVNLCGAFLCRSCAQVFDLEQDALRLSNAIDLMHTHTGA